MNAMWFLIALIVPLIWGIQAVMLKFGIGQFPPILMVSMRFAIMFVILCPFLHRLKGQFLWALPVIISQGVLHYSTFYFGFKFVSVAAGMIVFQTNVIFSIILAAVVGIAISLVGVALIIGMPHGESSIFGLVIIAISTFLFALGSVFVRKLGPFDPVGLNAGLAMVSSPSLLVVSLILENGQMQALQNATIEAWGALVYTAVFGGVIGFVLWFKLLSKFSVDRVSPFSLLMPFFAMIGSIIILGEHVSLSNWIGAIIIVLGTAIIQFGDRIFKKRPDALTG